jgi:hypothetical protein
VIYTVLFWLGFAFGLALAYAIFNTKQKNSYLTENISITNWKIDVLAASTFVNCAQKVLLIYLIIRLFVNNKENRDTCQYFLHILTSLTMLVATFFGTWSDYFYRNDSFSIVFKFCLVVT